MTRGFSVKDRCKILEWKKSLKILQVQVICCLKTRPLNCSDSCFLSQAIRGDDITVKSYRVESRITSRFAHVTVRSSVVNSGSKAQSIGFNVQIPKQAFITNFTMWDPHTSHLDIPKNSSLQSPVRTFPVLCCRNVNGITFVGSVKEKTVARNLYTQARARGKAAGIIRYMTVPLDWIQSSVELNSLIKTGLILLYRANSQDMETFKTEVHVPSGSNIEFELHYQEMMHRKLGHYEHNLYLQPGRLVPQFQAGISL